MKTASFSKSDCEVFLDQLANEGIFLKLWGEGLRVFSFEGKQLSQAHRDIVKQNKAEIISYLSKLKCPLSFSQERLWFLDQYEEQSSHAYNIPIVYQITGQLDITALERALNQLIERHEILRTQFKQADGIPYQVVQPSVIQKIELEDCDKDTIQNVLFEEIAKPFNLSQIPLIRVRLFKLGINEFVLCINQHHIITDAWSMRILWRELVSNYLAQSSKKSIQSQPLAIQYADYARWQRKHLSKKVLQQHLSYWQQQLQGCEVLQLITDKPRPTHISYRGDSVSFKIDSIHASQLQQFAKKQQTSTFIVLMSVLHILLSRYTGKTDICVGTPIANRNHEALEPLLGFFVNTLVLRADLSTNPAFMDLLKQLTHTALDAYAHQEIPFEHLVDKLDIERDTSRSPVFQVMLALQELQRDETQIVAHSDFKLEPFPMQQQVARFDLTFSLRETQNGLSGRIEYCSDLFYRQTIERLAQHFKILIQAVMQDSHCRIGHLPLLSAQEKQKILFDWNQTQQVFPGKHTIAELFQCQAAKTPKQLAIVCDDQAISYQQLDECANQLAHYLQAKGVGPEVLVGLAVERSVMLYIGMLGILKVGGAYVPLDPEYPKARLSFILQDTQLSVLLTQEKLLANIPACQANVVCLDKDWEKISRQPLQGVTTQTQPNNLAYIIYTSGSTGTPKGVMVEQRSVVNLSYAIIHLLQLNTQDRILQFASISFDAHVQDCFPTLLAGACLYIPSYECRLSGHQLGQYIEHHQITHAYLPPMMVKTMPITSLRILKILGLGGEVLSDPIANYTTQGIKLFNFYGPTEACVVTLAACLSAKDPNHTVGRPIANSQVYILDAYQQLAPIGVVGEIYIGGVGLARGYLNQVELTQEKFIQHPFSKNHRERLYKTGDLACYKKDGTIEFLGRGDNQVKIRGNRIELGEIENQLRQHQSVSEAVVIIKSIKQEKYLLAYWVACPKLSVTPMQLREYLQTKIPNYMIPTSFIQLTQLPLTASAKVDRKALSKLEYKTSGEGYLAPRNEIEAILVQIWCDVLVLERVGIHDNFFQLGGHSLLATQIISRVRSRFSQELAVRVLFQKPTIAGLARCITQRNQAACDQTIPVISREKAIHLSFAQQRLWFLDKYEGASSAAYHISMAFKLYGKLNVSALENALNQLIARHEILRTTFKEIDGNVYQAIAPKCQIKLQVQSCNEDTLAEQLNEVAYEPYHLSEGPLLKVRLFKLKTNQYAISVNQHHIVSDGWSIEILWRELIEYYCAFLEKREATLPGLTIQYADFAHWQREKLQGKFLQTQLAYWKQQLAGCEPLHLSTDKPRPTIMRHRGNHVSFQIDAKITSQLNQLAREHQTSLFVVLLSAFNVLLSRYTGQTDICVGTPVANRNYEAIEPLIGFFVNTLVLRADLSANPRFTDLIAQLTQTALDAYAYQDIPFEQLVEQLKVARDTSRSALFQVMLVFQHHKQASKPINIDLNIEPISLKQQSAKFDLTLTFQETSDALLGQIQFAQDLFYPTTLKRMIEHFKVLLTNIVQDSTLKLSALSVLTQQERQIMITDWNNTQINFSSPLTINQCFEAQAALTPNLSAVISEQHTLTYQSLDIYSNQLAHYLHRCGVGLGSLVAIAVARSVDMIIGILGILKAGGAYVPLDPDYPKARLDYMLQDSQAPFLLTHQKFLTRFSHNQTQIICLDRDWELIKSSSSCAINSKLTPDHLAYVIYTSGSTGKPKGVMVAHSGVVNRLNWIQSKHRLSHTDRFLQKASLSFDASAWEIFWPLTTGASLVLAKPGGQKDPSYLAKLIKARDVTVAYFVPSMLEVFLQEPSVKTITTLRICMCGGEALTTRLKDKFYTVFSDETALYNRYGPTEASIFVTYSANLANTTLKTRTVPIGFRVANIELYVLDQHLQCVPIGVIGELYIGGTGLARGYLNNPQLTKEKFISHPFKPNSGARLYKTGDRVRYLPDGNIEFIGRSDYQIKLRGFRIELGEIEAALLKYPAVNEAVVVVRNHESGDQQLLAYWVADSDKAITPVQLRDFLQSCLPEYMIPAVFINLDRLPLTPNGKLDRQALPKPGNLIAQDTYCPPRNEIEFKLTKIWESKLGCEPIGIHDNFFALGGHSLMAVQLIHQIQTTFNVHLDVVALFQKPTIAGVAECMHENNRAKAWSPLVAIQPKGSRIPIFCVHPAGGSAFAYIELAYQLGLEQPFYGLQARGQIEGQTYYQHLEEMVSSYTQAIDHIVKDQPVIVMGWSMGGKIAYEIAQQRLSQGKPVAECIILDCPTYSSQSSRDQAAKDYQKILTRDLFSEMGVMLAQAKLETLSTQAFLAYAFEQGQRANVIPPGATLSDIKRMIGLFQSNVEFTHHFNPNVYPGALTLLRAEDTPAVEKREDIDVDPTDLTMGWGSLARDGVNMHWIPGTHNTLLQKPHVQVLAQKLRSICEQAIKRYADSTILVNV